MRKAKQIGLWDLICVSLSITLGSESLALTVGAEPFHLYSQQETLRESQAQKGSQKAPRTCLYLFEREKWIWEMKLINSGFRPWCWERLRAGGEGDDRGWDGWMASPTQWTRVWVDSSSWKWTGRPGMLRFMGLQRVGHDRATELYSQNKPRRKQVSWFPAQFVPLHHSKKTTKIIVHVYTFFFSTSNEWITHIGLICVTLSTFFILLNPINILPV